MISIGAVNIDTSHPMGFAESLAKLGKRAGYKAVFNDSFRSDAEVEGFISRFGLAKRCSSLQELADCVDIGFIQGCDWDQHIKYSLPFIEKGKPVFIDKPLVGCERDCRELERLAAGGAVIYGSSSARYAFEITEFLAIDEAERGKIVHVNASCGVDHFNYGIHAVETIGGLVGMGAQEVSFSGGGSAGGMHTESCHIRYASGISASYTTFTGLWHPFVLTVMTTKNTYVLKLDASKLYDALMLRICETMETGESTLAPVTALTESVRIMLAGQKSKKTGRPERLDSLSLEDKGFDGAAFCSGYAAQSGSMYAL